MAQSTGERNGSAHATEALYRKHRSAVAALCRSLLRDRGDAEDATQQVFLSAHRALLNGSEPREPHAWLLAVARHECYARFRQRATSPLPVGDAAAEAAPDASVPVLRSGELATMWDEVGRMPAAQRHAFLLREVRGLSYEQLAIELSLSQPSVRSLLLRARTRLRHRLRDVAAGFGGVPWIQSLVRLVAGGDGASPLPQATKAAAVGIGALALLGGTDVARAPHHVSATPARTVQHRQAQARVRHTAEAVALATTPAEDRPGREDRSRNPGSGTSGSDSGHRGGGQSSASGEGSAEGGDDRGSSATLASQPPTDAHDGGGRGPSSGSGSASSGSGSGSDSGSGSSGSDGSGSSHGSGSGDDGSGGGSDGGDSGSSGSGGPGG